MQESDEVEKLNARVAYLSNRIKRLDEQLPSPQGSTRADRRRLARWFGKRNELLNEYQAANRRLAELALPQSARSEGDPPTIFDSHLLLPFEHPGTKARLQRLWDAPQETGRFLRNSLLYDRIFVPTVDLLVLILLIPMIGPENLIESLETGDITLVRYRGAIGYVGNGNGLEMFEIRSNLEDQIQQEHDRTWAPTEDVLASLGNQFASSSESDISEYWPTISRLVLEHIWEVDSSEFNAVSEATYRDILGNPSLQAMFEAQRGSLKSLPGVGQGLRWLGSERLNDDVDRLLHIAQFNFESYMADKVGALDSTAGPGVQTLLTERASRRVGTALAHEGFDKILNLARMPEFSSLHEDDNAIQALWRLRRTRDAQDFRRWFHETVRENPEEAASRCYETLGKPSLAANPVFRAVRYVAFSVAPTVLGAGIEGMLVGLGASAVDSFLVDRFLKPRGPKVMIDRLGGILPHIRQPQEFAP